MKENIFITDDGSQSIRSSEFEVSYHSKHGAVQESMHVFIDAGLRALPPSFMPIHIFEMGFGTGLNAYLSLLETQGDTPDIYYTSIEAYPLTPETYQSLDYPVFLKQNSSDYFQMLHEAKWDAGFQQITSKFHLRKIQGQIESLQLEDTFHVIFYDAFAPGSQPQLWEAPVMQKMYDLLKPGGILTTYCAQGAFKRTLKAIGFQVEPLPGPPMKREMTRARKLL